MIYEDQIQDMLKINKPKSTNLSLQPLPVCALRKLAGFADKSTSVAQPQTQTRNASGTEIGTRYRYIDDTPLVPFSENATSTSAGTTAQTRSRPSNEYVLYSYGEPVAMTADGNASYFGTDILGSVRNTTDKYGAVQSEYNYDAFGAPYLSNLDHDIGFGYCGKVYDNGTGLYDYGFRDYSPNQARFTTVDPIRDGANWFSYVVNDPVNYIDPFGLEATDNNWWSKARSTLRGWGESIKADLNQTWNDIKDVFSGLMSSTQQAVSTFISNTQANFSKWNTQARNELSRTWNAIKTQAAKAVVWLGVNLLGGYSTRQIYNDALKGRFKGIPGKNGEDYGVAEGLLNELDQTWDIETGNPFLDVLIDDLKNGNYNKTYNVNVGKNPGFSDMETAIGKHKLTIHSISEENGVVTVTIHAHDIFDFQEEEKGARSKFNEFVTGVANQAGLGSNTTAIDVYYELTFENNGGTYVYIK